MKEIRAAVQCPICRGEQVQSRDDNESDGLADCLDCGSDLRVALVLLDKRLKPTPTQT